ncbi:RNA polymerase sigma24 factor [Longispora fulva]|nr:RNA polymerase sigma24 factor [Longispora fulva]
MGGNSGEVAIANLYDDCYRRLVTQLYAFTGDLAEAQDAVQEAFARALARPKHISDIENPEAWLRTVAVNLVRRRWRRRRLFDTIMMRTRPVTSTVEPGPEPDRTDLLAALAQLPQAYREVIVLHHLADLPVDEVATTLDLPVGTVKSRLSRGRTALATRLRPAEAELSRHA